MIRCDVVVLGVGGMGSAACYHLAKRGARVVGIEQFQVGHERGSSHGQSRIFRKSYFEHPNYVPLLRRAEELLKRLNVEGDNPVFHQTGLVCYCPRLDSPIASGVLRSAQSHRIPVEVFRREEALARFPQFLPPEEFFGLWEPGAGWIDVENCVVRHAELAKRHGASIHEGETVLDWKSESDEVMVRSDREEYRCRHLIVTAGAWTTKILQSLELPLTLHRNTMYWFAVEDTSRSGADTPCFAFEFPDGFYYGFPISPKNEIKAALHKPGIPIEEPSQIEGPYDPKDLQGVQRFLRTSVPSVKKKPVRHQNCIYTMTPDGHFLLDRHPRKKNVILAAGFSGHGFKFSPAIGEALAAMALGQSIPFSLDFLSWKRW